MNSKNQQFLDRFRARAACLRDEIGEDAAYLLLARAVVQTFEARIRQMPQPSLENREYIHAVRRAQCVVSDTLAEAEQSGATSQEICTMLAGFAEEVLAPVEEGVLAASGGEKEKWEDVRNRYAAEDMKAMDGIDDFVLLRPSRGTVPGPEAAR